MKTYRPRMIFIVAVLVATGLILGVVLRSSDTRTQTSIIPESLARKQALVFSVDDGLFGGAVTPPSAIYGKVMTYGEAVRFATGRPLLGPSEAYNNRNKTVWLLVLEGKFVEHVPPSFGGDIPAKDVSHSQMAMILDGNTGEIMQEMLLSPQTKLSVADLPLLKESRGPIPALPTHKPIIPDTPYPTNEGSSASQSNDATTVFSSNPSNTDWVSKATTVNELTLESDLVVRARVSTAPVTRVLRQVAPVWDEKGNIVDSVVDETLFSDTVFEVLRTYRGKSSSHITVMQTGGFDLAISKGIEEVADDPLYKIGEEYVLFLVDISGDPVQAPDRELYRIVNPFGRYKIENKNVFSYGQNVKSVQLPTNITALETQIQRAAPMPTEVPVQTPLLSP